VVEQHTGQVRILDLSTGQIVEEPFLDIPDVEIAQGGEQGLLGLASHPDFAVNGFVFVNLTNADGDTEIRRYTTLAGDPDRIDPGSETLIARFDRDPQFANHNGGWIGFGPEGCLYISSGDDGGSGDPNNNAQNIDSLFGKILRIDVNSDGFPSDAARNYAIPVSNPFVGGPGADEVWALGLRNPWRLSFDPVTGDLYIADVGEGGFEEINWQPASSRGGENYGWKVLEGPGVYDASEPGNPAPNDPSLIQPVHHYEHSPENGSSVTGGYVYHGPAAGLQGYYVFGDFITGRIWALRLAEGQVADFVDLTPQLITDAGDIDLITSFAVDGRGQLYVLGRDGEVHRLEPRLAVADGPDLIIGGAGNDRAFGGSGRDTLNGGADHDTLRGGLANDTIIGAAGRDKLFGEGGGDTLKGGRGPDDFVFTKITDSGTGKATRDIIEDFRGKDDIVLRAIDAVQSHKGNQAFDLDRDGSFDAGAIRQSKVAGGLLLEMNVDRDARAEMSIFLKGVGSPLSDGDFVF
jgi:Ca2+-binding RTX toxin-like protein